VTYDVASIIRLEQSVVGAVLIDNDALDAMPSLEPGAFHDPRAQRVWAAFRSLRARRSPMDLTTVEQEIILSGSAGDWLVGFLADCAVCVPDVKNAVEYAGLIREAALHRDALVQLGQLLADAKAGRLYAEELLSAAMAGLSRLSAQQPDDAVPIGRAVRECAAELERMADMRARGIEVLTGFPTGVATLDEITGGWQPGIGSVVAGRPAMGKSSLLLATAFACARKDVGVHVFTPEDTRSTYAIRALAVESQVPVKNFRALSLSRDEYARLSPAMGKLIRQEGWLVDDRSGIDAAEIVRSARRHAVRNKTRVVVVDYLQMLKAPRGVANRHEALGENMQTLVDAAKQDNMSYIIGSQLNRDVEKRADKRPQLADLRESGSIEEKAKCVVGLYRGSYYSEHPSVGVDFDDGERAPTLEEFRRQAQLIVLKLSQGETGTVFAEWRGETVTMR
jgi:replicative DNA helicase